MIFLEADTVIFKYHETAKHQINSDYKIISETEIPEEDNSVKILKFNREFRKHHT